MGTTKMIIYIGAALGSLNYQGQAMHIISAQSPLAIAFKGHAVGDVVNFNQKNIKSRIWLNPQAFLATPLPLYRHSAA